MRAAPAGAALEAREAAMYVRLRQARRLGRDRYRLTLDVVSPERNPWDLGDCVVQVDVTDRAGSHVATPRGILEPAIEAYRLCRDEPPTSTDSRLLWEIGRAADQYIAHLFAGGVLCPFTGTAKDDAAERPDESRE
jgi:hypothetical protein